MTLDGITGNTAVVKALRAMSRSGRIPHAMMFYENDGCGALDIVLAFLSEVFRDEHKVGRMIHPDVHYIYPVASGSKVKEKTENLRAELFLGYWRDLMAANPFSLESEVSDAFGVEGKQTVINNAEAKEVLGTVYLTSVEGGYKAVVVYLPEKMNATAANRLLKAVEEPPEKTLFLMVTHAPEKVLQTISSRCQSFRILPYSKEEIVKVLVERFSKSEEEAMAAAQMARGSVGEAVSFLSDRAGHAGMMDIFRRLMDALASRDLPSALPIGDELAALGSREKQKAFCIFAGECLRKIFLIQQNLTLIAGIAPDEEQFLRTVASRCRKTFPRIALAGLDRARMLIDRNVNQKILFCDLVGRLYLSF